MKRPAWIALAHELIHAWRLVCGTCVFRPSAIGENYYEEAMTVGLPPYDGCRYSENRLRLLKGLPLRTFYGPTTQNQSVHAASKHGSAADRLKLVSIRVEGSAPTDPLVFEYELRADNGSDVLSSGKTNAQGRATAEGPIDCEIRFSGFGAAGRVETQWQKIVAGRYMDLQFGRYRFICEAVTGRGTN
jgi:hypothetical protein